MKAIKATIGYKEVSEGKPTRYFPGDTPEGYCYKDLSAIGSDEVCYIPESAFKGNAYIENGNKFQDIMDYVEVCCQMEGLPHSERFIKKIAENCLKVAEWESIGTVVDRIDLEEEWALFRPTYRFILKSNGKPLKHFANAEDYGFYLSISESNDKEMEDHGRGMHIALAGVFKKPSVEVYCLDEIGEYRIIAKFN